MPRSAGAQPGSDNTVGVAGATAAEHDAGVRASLAWYEDVFAVHRIPTRSDDALWWALAEPPPWHSAAKTLRRDVTADRVLRAVEPFEHCSVADSYGTVDLAPAGFQRLFAACWLHREAPSPAASLLDGWGVVTELGDLERWNELHDYTGVLLPAFLEHPRFTVLARHGSKDLSAAPCCTRSAPRWSCQTLGAEAGHETLPPCRVRSGPPPRTTACRLRARDELGRWLTAGFCPPEARLLVR